eukprot:CAMPEP_0179198286 /NCGR_PEP_ID=MMETSP0796-20121207/98622_1 /TAXON_ID=73915 /ORGANISM="Pyrodinium bahamense, Strain pbaha01" /LENGTH=63 /DNA_ID=CAMNT_0020902733 /DNA_START=50 /DNA_END=237 /DNA_ORIENTATION=-
MMAVAPSSSMKQAPAPPRKHGAATLDASVRESPARDGEKEATQHKPPPALSMTRMTDSCVATT